MTFKSPFRADEKISLFDLFNKINKGEYSKINDEKYSLELRNLVDSMMIVKPEERVTLEEVILTITKILKICQKLLKEIEENKPKIDPFIIMEDIIEKFRLINYEVQFCKKFHILPISRIFFACPSKGNIFTNSNINFPENTQQFLYFLEITYWLIFLIKEVR